jgi:hypothetical protein
VVGKQLPPLQTDEFEWVRDLVGVIVAVYHAIDKVEKLTLDGIRHHDRDLTNPHLITFLLVSFVYYF